MKTFQLHTSNKEWVLCTQIVDRSGAPANVELHRSSRSNVIYFVVYYMSQRFEAMADSLFKEKLQEYIANSLVKTQVDKEEQESKAHNVFWANKRPFNWFEGQGLPIGNTCDKLHRRWIALNELVHLGETNVL